MGEDEGVLDHWRRLSGLPAVALAGLLVLTGALSARADEPVVTPGPTAIQGIYGRGFRFATEDGRFSLRLSAAMQLRYSYVAYDDRIEGNETDYSNFHLRRARLWWDGHAYNERLIYFFHLQLEPSGFVNLHDAWVQYRFHELAQLGLGRNKIAYGLEFLNSGFGLNLVDRSVMYGETDIDIGGGLSRYPGGGTGRFGIPAQNLDTGFHTGGMTLYRSQGIQLQGFRARGQERLAFEYQLGVWQGRATRGLPNPDANHLLAGRVAVYPLGWINWLAQGDVQHTEKPRLGLLLSAYTSKSPRTRNAVGDEVPRYESQDSGVNLALETRFRGFSGDVEWSRERYELRDPSLMGENRFERQGYRIALGYFVTPKRVELVGRYAELRRLKDPSVEAALNSGLGLAGVKDPEGALQEVVERKIHELTFGLNYYFSGDHQHKVFCDFSQLRREFAGFVREGQLDGAPEDQIDYRFRTMLQIKF